MYNYNPTLFDNLATPESVEKNALISLILTECAELECVYADAEFMQNDIGSWSHARTLTWNRISSALQESYSVISPYKRTESWTTSVENNVDGESLTDVSAFNSSTYEPRDKNSTSSTGTGVENRMGEINGNMINWTPQQLIKQEVEVSNINLYNTIVAEFKQRYCLMVY